MPYQDSGDCSSLLSSFGAELDLRQEHKQEEGFKNNYTALVLPVHKINIIHMSDPIKSTALSIAHKMKAHNHLTISNLRDFFICAPWDKEWHSPELITPL